MIKIINGRTDCVRIAEDTAASFSRQCEIAKQAVELLAHARAAGVILNIDQLSRPPLAMGHHVDVVTVHAARKMAAVGGSS